jgi:TetR/AcrR family transcriptional repressor of nem operon
MHAIGYFSAMAEGLFSGAPFTAAQDPLDRLLGYTGFRATILNGELPQYTCLLGTLVQETYATHPELQASLRTRHVGPHRRTGPRSAGSERTLFADAPWSAESAAYFIQSFLQGSFIFANAKQGPDVVRDSLVQQRRYQISLFAPSRAHSKESP